MARLTRQELKQDRLRTVYEEYEQFARDHFREIVWFVGVVLLVSGLIVGTKVLIAQLDESANARLANALETFHATVGAPPPGAMGGDQQFYPTAEAKYQKALLRFLEVTNVRGWRALLLRPRAAILAVYYAGLCQEELGNHAAAMRTFEEASRDSHKDVSALARFALAGELVRTGKTAEGVRIYDELAAHPTSTVTRDVALLGKADALRASQPAQARALYDQVQKEFSTDPRLASQIGQQAPSLPK